jgi:cytosine/creatinine deaminase
MLIIPSWSSHSARDLISPPRLLLREASLADGRVANVLIRDGTIVEVADNAANRAASAKALNLRGYLLLPSFAEPHASLGHVFSGKAFFDSLPGPSLDAALGWQATAPARSGDAIARTWTAAMNYLVNGTTAIRARVDVTDMAGLETLQMLLDLRTCLAGVMDVQIVAVAPAPVAGRAGARHRGSLCYALAAGADLAGGAPALDGDPDSAVEMLAVTAANAGAGLDLDVGEIPDLAARTLSRLLMVSEAGFDNPVTASHVTSLAIPPERRRAFLRSLARAGIGAVTIPKVGPERSGASAGASPARRFTGMRQLLAAGVTVAASGSGRLDPDAPPGQADPLATASLLGTVGRLPLAAALAAVTSAGRQIMRLPEVRIAPGFPADLVAVRAVSLRDAIATRASDRIVLRGGRVVARTRAGAESAMPEFHAICPVWN